MPRLRHLIQLTDLSAAELRKLLARATVLREQRSCGERPRLFAGRVLVMIFEKSSTRTRVAFETAMVEGGGSAIFLPPHDSQLGRGEPLRDTARVLSQMCDVIMARTYKHETVEVLAEYATVPVINGLTDRSHPCQLLADLQTYQEHRGDIGGRRVAWIGDGNNMCNSYIEAAGLLNFELVVASPKEYAPVASVYPPARVTLTEDPVAAVENADLVVTDVWASMGQESEAQTRRQKMKPYQVNEALMGHAKPDALFMHCLPAHRGEEVTEAVIEGQWSVVWNEAGNRLHAQKALLEFLLNDASTVSARGAKA